MPRVAFDVHTVLPAATVLTMLTDFTARRPALWPTLSPKLYEVYELGPTSADVKEGSSKPVVIWERAHYGPFRAACVGPFMLATTAPKGAMWKPRFTTLT